MGMFTTSFMGLFPIGSLMQGSLAQYAGIRITITGTACAALMAVILIMLRCLRREKRE
jgi:hypothetical protein